MYNQVPNLPLSLAWRKLFALTWLLALLLLASGCHGLNSLHRLKRSSLMNQTSMAQKSFGGSSACDAFDGCAGYTETSWTSLSDCDHWDTSYEEIPGPTYMDHEISVGGDRYAPMPHHAAPPSLIIPSPQATHRFEERSDVQQVGFSTLPEPTPRDSGVNEEVVHYAEQMSQGLQSVSVTTEPKGENLGESLNQSEPSIDRQADKLLEDIAIEYLQ
jgi:hypothetical protein